MATYISSSTSTTASWYTWCDVSTTQSATAVIWNVWADQTPATTVWNTWNANVLYYQAQVEAFAAQAEEQTRRHATFYAEQEAKLAAERAKREVAERRAEELLVANLDLRQREQFAKHRAFIVHGRNARYRVRKGRSGNVDVLGKDGRVVDRLCCHTRAWVPDCDTMLAQLLWLSTAEEEFVRKANRHGPGLGELVALEAA